MKKLFLIAVVVLLQGCAIVDAYLMTGYDSNEYRIITEIRADAQGYKAECANPLTSSANAVAIADKTRLFTMYSQYVPRNTNVQKASSELNAIAQGLSEQYKKTSTVSPLFCKIKFEAIEHSAETMQKVIGAKPR
jgi:hypothetical protein